MKNTTLPFLILCISFFAACHKKEESSVYKNCCGAEAITDVFQIVIPWTDDQGMTFDTTLEARVYIPNIFIPSNNGDFESSFFMPFTNEAIAQVVSLRYVDDMGSTLFSRFNFQPNDISFAWFGKLADGSFYSGGFNFEISMKLRDGNIKIYTGKACSYSCGEGKFPTNRLPDCLFPNQNNGLGSPDPTKPQPLNCFN